MFASRETANLGLNTNECPDLEVAMGRPEEALDSVLRGTGKGERIAEYKDGPETVRG